MINERYTAEGEYLQNYMVPLELNKCEVFMWPTDVVHEINEDSPLWDVSASDLMNLK